MGDRAASRTLGRSPGTTAAANVSSSCRETPANDRTSGYAAHRATMRADAYGVDTNTPYWKRVLGWANWPEIYEAWRTVNAEAPRAPDHKNEIARRIDAALGEAHRLAREPYRYDMQLDDAFKVLRRKHRLRNAGLAFRGEQLTLS